MAGCRARFADAIHWIAGNDETGESDPAVMEQLCTVCLVADLWGRSPWEVAVLVLKHRREQLGILEANKQRRR
jgi:hypothetical protein